MATLVVVKRNPLNKQEKYDLLQLRNGVVNTEMTVEEILILFFLDFDASEFRKPAYTLKRTSLKFTLKLIWDGIRIQ